MTDKNRFDEAMLHDDSLFEQFIAECEMSLQEAPPEFAGSVMRSVRERSKPAPPSRSMLAAVCFCSAAAVLALTFFGVDKVVFDFFRNSGELSGVLSGRVNELLSSVKLF
ncbi:MAG: hypothetical protein FWG36_01725 [Oscillospiraceae bacterium]|nr:hypothetical protein [Oscillospiraceae bacterium]